jgi:hypothetical protein
MILRFENRVVMHAVDAESESGADAALQKLAQFRACNESRERFGVRRLRAAFALATRRSCKFERSTAKRRAEDSAALPILR